MKRFLKRTTAVVLAMAISMMCFPALSSYAKTKKPKVEQKSIAIPIGEVKDGNCWLKQYEYKYGGETLYGLEPDYESNHITVKNAEKGKKLTYSSEDKSIAKVNKKGKVTGVKPGTTKIKVFSGKKKIGTVKVTVNEASVCGNIYDLNNYSLGQNYGYFVLYKNAEAEYTAVSDSGDLKIKSNGDGGFDITANKTGSYNITVYESVGEDRRELGTVTVKVNAPEGLKETYKISRGDSAYEGYVCRYFYPGVVLKVTKGEGTVLVMHTYKYEDGSGTTGYEFEAVGKGRAEIQISDKGGNIYGTTMVLVTDAH